MKRSALIFLTLQNVSSVLLSRYVRSRPGDMFISSTAVALSELVKFIVCLFAIFFHERMCFSAFFRHLRTNLFTDCRDNLLIGVPGIIYSIQNNLAILSVSHLNASIFQVTYQLKILTTALFFRIIMHRLLTLKHWAILVLLFAGVAITQIDPSLFSPDKAIGRNSSSVSSNNSHNLQVPSQRPLVGLLCVISACMLSGFAGVFFELILKSTEKTVLVRNIQLSVYGFFTSLLSVFIQDWNLVISKGFFHGYNLYVWINVFILSLGGLLVAVVVLYADNILKNIATSIAIVLTLVVSVLFLEQRFTWFLLTGNCVVVFSAFAYNLLPSPSVSPTNHICLFLEKHISPCLPKTNKSLPPEE